MICLLAHADVFLKFRDDKGNFASDDLVSLLALYNAPYLRIHGEEKKQTKMDK